MDGQNKYGNGGQASFGMSSGPSFGSFTFDESKVKVPEPAPQPEPTPAPQSTPENPVSPTPMEQPMSDQPMPGQPPMGQPMPAQPVPVQPPMGQPPVGQPMPAPQDNYQVNHKKTPVGLIVGIALAVFVILAVVVVALIMYGQPPAKEPEPEPEPQEIDYEANVPTLINAKRFCATSGLYVWDLPDEPNKWEAVYGTVNCRYNDQKIETTVEDEAKEEGIDFDELTKEPTNDIITLDYYVLTKDHKELELVKSLQGDYSSYGSELENTDDFKVFYRFNYSMNYTVVSYTVFYKNSVLLMSAKNAEEIEKALTSIGFPKTEHEIPTEESEAKKREEEREQGKATPAKRDVLRRNDMARVSTSLTQYMTNNKGELPGASMWVATPTFAGENACKADNAACNFVMSYLNTATDDKNTFEDPSGNVYNFLITGDVSNDGEIGNTTFSANSKLTTQSKKYAIGGKNPFYEYVVYIIPGAKCDGTSAKPAKKGDYTILYKLEEGQTYCLNN